MCEIKGSLSGEVLVKEIVMLSFDMLLYAGSPKWGLSMRLLSEILTGWEPIWGTILVKNRKLADCHNNQFYFCQHNSLEKLPGERIGTITSEVWFDSVSSANKVYNCMKRTFLECHMISFWDSPFFPFDPTMCLATLTKLHCFN